MKRTKGILLCCFFMIASLAACAPSRLAMDYGTSFKQQKFSQIADSEAGKKVEPVEGMNGKAAEAAMGRYQKSFEKEPPPQVYHLTIEGIK